MKIKSEFAILDVLKGNINKLEARLAKGPLDVTIKGQIGYAHGRFDGTSREFVVMVNDVELDAKPE